MTLVSVETQVSVMIAQVITVGLLNKRMEKKNIAPLFIHMYNKDFIIKM